MAKDCMAFMFHKKGLVLTCAVTALVVAGAAVPWKSWVANRLTAMLESQGFQNVHLHVSSLGLTSITLQDVSVGDAPPLILKNVAFDYSLPDLVAGRVHELSLSGLALNMRPTNGKWGVEGLESWRRSPSSGNAFLLPVTGEQITGVPLRDAKLENSVLHMASNIWQMDIPLQLAWHVEPVPSLTYQGAGLSFKSQALKVMTGEASLTAILKADDKQWNGTWQIKNIQITGTQTPIPPLNGEGALTAMSDQINVNGALTNSDHSTTIAFSAIYFFNNPEKSELTINNAETPWNNGTLAIHQVVLPFQGDRSINVTLDIRRVSADMLMRQLMGDKTEVTGVISGHLPLTVERNGNITVHQGRLQSDGPGLIKMAPDAIPGDNEQVAFMREVMKDFHYNLLSIQTENDKDNRLTMRMNLEGNNPGVSNGRTVKMSINLTGDVLNFVQQNLLLLTDPKKLLEQDNNAKK